MKKRIALGVVAALAGALLAATPASAAGTLTVSARGGATVFRAASDSVQLSVSTSGLGDGTKVYAEWLTSADTGNTQLADLAGISPNGDNDTVDTLAKALSEAGANAADDATNNEDFSGWVYATGANAYATVSGSTPLLLHIDETENDTAGSYSIRIFADEDGSGDFSTGDGSATYSWVAGGAPAVANSGISFTKSVLSKADDNTTVLRLTLKDSSGRATREAVGTDAFDWDASDAAQGEFANAAADAAGEDDQAFAETVNDGVLYGGSGVYTATLYTTAATAALADGDVNVTIESVDGTAFTTSTYKATVKLISVATDADTVAATAATGLKISGTADAAATKSQTITALTTASTIYYTITGDAGDYVEVRVAKAADAKSVISDVTESTTYKLLAADGTAVVSVTNTTPVATESYTLTIEAGANDLVYTVTYSSNTPDLAVVSPASAFTVKTTSASALTVKATDVLGAALASAPVTVVVTGRNAGNAASLTTDANGLASYTVTDKSTATTTDQPSDTVVFTVTDADGDTDTATFTITYSTTGIAVSSVAVSTTDGNGDGEIAGADADAANDGRLTVDVVESEGSAASTSYATVKAVVKDANGAPVGAGALVTFKGGADDWFGTTAVVADMAKSATVVTGSNGEATAYVYRQKTGSTTVTAEVGGKSASSGTLTWLTKQANARSIAVSADPAKVVSAGIARVIGKVTDRWGNAVNSVEVTFSETGVGRLYGTQDNLENSNSNGEVFFDLTSLDTETGSNPVTLTVTEAGTQVDNLAGYVGAVAKSGVAAGVKSGSATVEFTAKAAAAADPTVTALTTQVQSLIVSVNAIIASMTKSITATNTAISRLVAAIQKLVAKR